MAKFEVDYELLEPSNQKIIIEAENADAAWDKAEKEIFKLYPRAYDVEIVLAKEVD